MSCGWVIDTDGCFIWTVPVKPVATLWHDGARRRFDDSLQPQRAKEIDWEQKYRQKSYG